MADAGAAIKSSAGGGKRRRRLGVCHHSGTALPAALRLLQDLARPALPGNHSSGPTNALQRRNAFRKSSAPPAKCIASGRSLKENLIEERIKSVGRQDRSSLTALSRSVSIIATPAAVLLYVSREQGPDHCWRWSRGQRRSTYPCAPKGVRRHRSGRQSLSDAATWRSYSSSWINPSGGVMTGDTT